MKNKRFTFLMLVLLIAAVFTGGQIISEKIKHLGDEVGRLNQQNQQKEAMLKTLSGQAEVSQNELNSTKRDLDNTKQEIEKVKQELVTIKEALDIANREMGIANKELDIACRVLDTANKLLDSVNKRVEAPVPAPEIIQK